MIMSIKKDNRIMLVEQVEQVYTGPDLFDESIKKQILEEKNFDKIEKIILKCILQRADTINRNKRIYPYETLKKTDQKYQELIKEERAYGELDHPERIVLSLRETSHRVMKTWWEDKTLWGSILLHTSPGFHRQGIVSMPGDVIAAHINSGGNIGISSRGLGSLKSLNNGMNQVQDDYEMAAFDLVAGPSVYGAFLAQGDDGMELLKQDFNKALTEQQKIFLKNFLKD